MNEILVEIKMYVSKLTIPGVNQVLKTSIEEADKFDKSYEEFLKGILVEAYDMRNENGKKNRIKNARFPYEKYPDEFKEEYLP